VARCRRARLGVDEHTTRDRTLRVAPRARRAVPKHRAHHASTRRERATCTPGPSCARAALRTGAERAAQVAGPRRGPTAPNRGRAAPGTRRDGRAAGLRRRERAGRGGRAGTERGERARAGERAGTGAKGRAGPRQRARRGQGRGRARPRTRRGGAEAGAGAPWPGRGRSGTPRGGGLLSGQGGAAPHAPRRRGRAGAARWVGEAAPWGRVAGAARGRGREAAPG
jgi:hypothetical protein